MYLRTRTPEIVLSAIIKSSLLFLFIIISTYRINAQSCVPTNINGTVINLTCSQPCTNLSFQVAHLKSTDNYIVNSIPYTPYPYVTATGIELTDIYIDDQFSDSISLGFPFCFYGGTYSKCVVGSNGVITFDVLTNAGEENAYILENAFVPQTIPFSGGTPGTAGDIYYPRASIMGPYHDIDPNDGTTNQPPDRRIEYRIEGSAPCRKFVASYFHVPYYAVPDSIVTQQMVFHENTGVVEVFIEHKSVDAPGSTNSDGLAILGMQNWNRDQAIWVPGRNCTYWEANNEGWRFTPNGGLSRYISSELLTMSGTLVALADTSTVTPGFLNVSFPNICPTGTTTQYIVKTTFTSCPVGAPLTSFDTITINRTNALTMTATSTATSCGGNTGTVTATIPAGTGTPPIVYTLAPGTIQIGNPVFTGLAAGSYTITATDAAGCTSGPVPVTVTTSTGLTSSYTSTQTTCTGSADGTITITTNGVSPVTFVMTGPGGPYTQTNPVFTGLDNGTYAATFTDATGCTGTINNMIVADGPTITVTSSTTSTSCSGVSDGSLTVTPNIPGTYTFTLNPGGITQSSGTFTGLAAGTYSVDFFLTAGCQGTRSNIVVTTGPALTGTATANATSCPGINNGTLTVTPGGTGPYTFTLNPGSLVQTSNIFTGLAPGTYTITFVTASGCAGTVNNIPPVIAGPALTSTNTVVNPPCAGINNGSITITPTGTAPYNFVVTGPGGPYTQTSPVFSNLAPGTYNYTFSDASGCTGSGSATLITNPPITATITMVMPLCNGNSNGTITVNGGGGVAPYQYSINAGTTWQGPTFTGLAAGTHTIRIRDNFGCIKDTTVTLNQPPVLTAAATSTAATCAGNDGTITITAGGGTPAYEYSIDNGTNYQVSNVFVAPAVGPYSTIRVRDSKGCIANANTVVALVDNMFLSAGNDTTVCAEQSVVLQPITNPQTNIFQWSPQIAINDINIKNPTVTPLSTQTYSLVATWGACTRQDQVTVTVLTKPVSYAGPDLTICYKDSTLLNGSYSNNSGGVFYVWTPGAPLSDDSTLNPLAVPDSTQTFILTITDDYGCNFSVADSMVLTMMPPVPANAGKDTIAILGVPHQLTATGGSYYMWNPTTTLSSPFSPNPLATLFNDTRFTVIVTDIAGCIGYDTVFVKVYEGPTYYTPNAFTPNGDGLNDIFRPVPVGIEKTEWFRVFNRYGQLVFETNEWLKGWDGTFKGKKQPLGTYVWMIKGKDKYGAKIELKGTVLLVQ